MSTRKSNEAIPYVVAILFGVIGGLCLWYWGAPNADILNKPPPSQKVQKSGTSEGDKSAAAPALRYAAAWQEGNCEEIVTMTWWMQERLNHVRSLSGDGEAVRSAEIELCADIQRHLPEKNELTPEGILDQYLFSRNTTIEVARVSEGRDDLAKPTKQSSWLQLTYQERDRAPRDESGNPIRSLDVAIYLSENGYVLKAGILGNAEIDWDSISLRWPSTN